MIRKVFNIKCIKDVVNDCDDAIILFTQGELYTVEDYNGEWRTKDNTCGNSTPYNHIVKTTDSDDRSWFNQYFSVEKMSYFEKRLTKGLQNEEFNKEWEDSEEEYLATRDAIILERLERLEKNPESAIPWRDVKRENLVAESLEQSLKEMQQIREDDKEAKSWDDFIVEIESEE